MLNHTTIQGRLTRDPEIRYTQSGKPVASFTMAWSEKYNDNEQKVFLPCVAWQKQAEFVGKYFTKGQEAIAEGKLISRKWTDKEGNNRETIELIVDHMHFCGSKKEGNQNSAPAYGQAAASAYGQTGGYSGYDPGYSGGYGAPQFSDLGDPDDGDLPF